MNIFYISYICLYIFGFINISKYIQIYIIIFFFINKFYREILKLILFRETFPCIRAKE